jgi:hypothetical protein
MRAFARERLQIGVDQFGPVEIYVCDLSIAPRSCNVLQYLEFAVISALRVSNNRTKGRSGRRPYCKSESRYLSDRYRFAALEPIKFSLPQRTS